MLSIPQSLEETVSQAKAATQRALEAGCQRVQVEIVLPEIALEAQSLALQFAELFESYGAGLKILFPDTGAAALARRDWGETVFKVTDLGSSRTPVEVKLSEDDEVFLVVAASAVEVAQVEKLCNWALERDRPVVLIIPQLENVATIGIGYAARQLRERFLSTLETAYYLRPFEGGTILRAYPSPWEVWLEKEEGYEKIAEEATKPIGERLERIIMGAIANDPDQDNPAVAVPKKTGVLGSLQQFLKALSS
ncbi:DUF1995 family protein [Spirulina subsalsa]|uniref:DUF1995 family protein n=1 Tax=Spirulina subsalsa TaxID=54311 RepID=UPI0002F239D6|nr:DUF1995 family protein [Spirulina subsalsa]